MSPHSQYLLDTNVLSETRRRVPEPRVIAFLQQAGQSNLFLSVLTLGELKKGIDLKRKSDEIAARALGVWADGLEASFADRILGIDAETAKLWGEWSSQRPRSTVDTLLAATCMIHRLTLVTRNIADVAGLPVPILDPWLGTATPHPATR